jgi:hypothetical protein
VLVPDSLLKKPSLNISLYSSYLPLLKFLIEELKKNEKSDSTLSQLISQEWIEKEAQICLKIFKISCHHQKLQKKNLLCCRLYTYESPGV